MLRMSCKHMCVYVCVYIIIIANLKKENAFVSFSEKGYVRSLNTFTI